MKFSLGFSALALAACVGLTACGSEAASDAATAAASAAASAAGDVASSAVAGAASAASSAVGEATAATCKALVSLQESVAEQTDPQATVGEVRAAAQQAQSDLDALAADAGAVQGVLIAAVRAAESSLLTSLENQPADAPIAEASNAVNQALTALKSAYDALSTALGC